MKAGPPFVSVIIPVYNGDAFLAEAIESILQQDYAPLEIITVDDGSTDGSAKVATSFKDVVRYVYQPNSGTAAARNTGVQMARGDIIGFLDQDDLWPAGKLALQLTRLADHPSVEIVLGHKQLMWLTGIEDGRLGFEIFSDPQIALNLGCALFRISVFDKVGFFDETLYYVDDWDWFMRARELGVPMVIHHEVTLISRRHKHNMSNRVDLGNLYAIRMLKKSLHRRRQQNNGLAMSLPKLSDFEEKSTG